MALQSAMRQQAQIGLETTEGAGGVVNKRFTAFGITPSPNIQTSAQTPTGQTAPSEGGIAFEDSAFSVADGRLDYIQSIYLLESAVKKVTATTPANGTASRQRVYNVSQFSSDPFQTYKMEFGDPGAAGARGQSAVGCNFTGFGFEVSSEGTNVTMTGDGLGGKLVDGAITTTAITPLASKLVLPSQAKVFYATSAANLTASPIEITNDFSVAFAIGDRRQLYRFLGRTDTGPSGSTETAPSITLNLTLADETNPIDTFMANARAGTKQFFRVQFTGPQIEMSTAATPAPINYQFTLDMCCVLGGGPGREEVQGILGRSFPYMAAYDSVWDNIFQITSVSNLATL